MKMDMDLLWMFLFCTALLKPVDAITATCELQRNSALPLEETQTLQGTITLEQPDGGGSVTITGAVSGFNATDSVTEHGFHIHTSSDFSTGCNSAGGHFNPHSLNHGAPTDAARHVGDLGNILENSGGAVDLNIVDNTVTLVDTSSNYVGERAIVIHALADDLGKVNNSGSLATGNAGARLACCKITTTAGGTSSSKMVSTILTVILPLIAVFGI